MEDQDYDVELALALAELEDEPSIETFYLALSSALQRLKAYRVEFQAQA